MVERSVVIKNETGLHARPASQFIAFVTKFKADVILVKGDKKANGKSILNLLTLALNKGSEVTIQVSGEDEENILNAIVEFVENLKD